MTDQHRRLRLALQRESENIGVSPHLRGRIDARLRPASKMRRRAIALAVAVVVVLGGVVVWVATKGPTAREVVGQPTIDDYFEGYWPESTKSGAEAMQRRVDAGEETWRTSPDKVAEAYAKTLGWTVAPVKADPRTGDVRDITIQPMIGEGANLQPGPEHLVHLVSLHGAENPAWFVAGLTTPNIAVKEPQPQATITSSPQHLSGTGLTFEGAIDVSLYDDAHKDLGHTVVMGGGSENMPFDGAIDFTDPSTIAGVLKFEGSQGIEGPSTTITVVRVRFAKQAAVDSVDRSTPNADESFHCIVEARVRRDVEGARACMTARYASSINDPVEFIGASSPSLDRSTIISSSQRPDGRLTYDVLSYWGSSRGLLFTSEDLLTFEFDGTKWLADGWETGEYKPVREAIPVTMYFLAPGDTPRCEGGSPTATSFVPRGRDVLNEVVDDVALSVVREAVTGPWLHEGDAAGAFGDGVRVERVRRYGNTIEVTLSGRESATREPAIDCDYSLESLRRSLRSIPEFHDVDVVMVNAPPQPSAEPDV